MAVKCLMLIIALCVGTGAYAANIVVAASNSSPEAKAKADYVCDGKDDQVELANSCSGARFSVEWLPGDYYLGSTLVVPPTGESTIRAEGTYFHYLPDTGDAVTVQGMIRCRYYLGTIETTSSGAAIGFRPAKRGVNTLMSVFRFTGLIGSGQKGTGMILDCSTEGIATNRFEGSEITGFDTGVCLTDSVIKCDTNWFWISSIRSCNTCIREMHVGVDDSVFHVCLDTNLHKSTAIRTDALFGKYDCVIRNNGGSDTKALVLDQGAAHNVLEFHPPFSLFKWQDLSNGTNVILSTDRPPYSTGKAGN